MTKQGKRYYWLKLHENFFRQAVIRFLRKMPEGDSIVIIYLELLLMSIKTDGYVRTDGLYDTMEKDLKTGGASARSASFRIFGQGFPVIQIFTNFGKEV